MTTVEHKGWLLDIFADPQGGLIWWWIGADGTRLRLRQPFQVTFYVSGSAAKLHTLAQYLHQQPETPILERVQRRDLFREQPLDVLAVRLNSAPRMDELFRRVSAGFPDLTYYDTDIPIALRCAAQTDVFPLAHCRFTAEGDTLLSVQTLDTRWELDPEPAPLRVLQIIPDVNPAHADPAYLTIHSDRFDCRLPLQPERALLINLRAMLEQHDPDVLLTDWGDT
jgi:DNA polymerase elongation subunit (family B)